MFVALPKWAARDPLHGSPFDAAKQEFTMHEQGNVNADSSPVKHATNYHNLLPDQV